jgi:electron transfer flavoprotein alpha subunit
LISQPRILASHPSASEEVHLRGVADMSEVLVLVDHIDGVVHKSTHELLAIANRLGEPSAMFIGEGGKGAAVAVQVKSTAPKRFTSSMTPRSRWWPPSQARPPAGPDLSEAEIVVSGGRGTGGDLGISGAIQHRAGKQTAKTIIAINKDEDAPIFELVDFGVVGDLHEVLRAVTSTIKSVPN